MSRLTSLVAGLLLLASAGPAAELVDPTRPALLPGLSPEAPAGEPEDPRSSLQSIFISDGQRVAVIGGRRVEVGDPVGDAQVVAIELSGVRLRDTGGEWTLTLTGTSGLRDRVKRPAAAQDPAKKATETMRGEP